MTADNSRDAHSHTLKTPAAAPAFSRSKVFRL